MGCIGGAWNEVDGADPYDDNVLTRTLIRSSQEMLQLDLSKVSKFVKVLEVEYDREKAAEDGATKERTVLFMPVWGDVDPESVVAAHAQIDVEKMNEQWEKIKQEEAERKAKEEERKKKEQ